MLSRNPGLWFRCVMHWPCPPVSTYTWPRPPGQRFRGWFFGAAVLWNLGLRLGSPAPPVPQLLWDAPMSAYRCFEPTRACSVDLLSAYYENENLSFDNNTAGIAFAVQLTR